LADHFLLKTQQNEVFAAIRAAGLNPADFAWADVQTETTKASYLALADMRVPLLTHEPTQGYFIFDFDAAHDHHYAIYAPGVERPEERINATVWANELGYVRQWLKNLTREWTAPNFWEEFSRQRELVAGIGAEVGNTPFTAEEQAEIARQLNEAKQYVRQTHQLTAGQYETIDARLDYLVDAASRTGRIDWRNAFVGVLLGAAVETVVPPEVIRDVLSLTLRGLGHLFGVDVPGLPGG
jgi:hypothetical protein